MLIYPVALNTEVVSFTPSLMMSATIAMSIGTAGRAARNTQRAFWLRLRLRLRLRRRCPTTTSLPALSPTGWVGNRPALLSRLAPRSSLASPRQPADYSLFLLTRLTEELKGGRDMPESVLYMLWSAGHTILVSGSTLSLCFFGLCAFPSMLRGSRCGLFSLTQCLLQARWVSPSVSFPRRCLHHPCCFVLTCPPVPLLSTPGLGAGVSIAVALVVNLTFTPAMLLAFPNFFRRAIAKKCVARKGTAPFSRCVRPALILQLSLPLPRKGGAERPLWTTATCRRPRRRHSCRRKRRSAALSTCQRQTAAARACGTALAPSLSSHGEPGGRGSATMGYT